MVIHPLYLNFTIIGFWRDRAEEIKSPDKAEEMPITGSPMGSSLSLKEDVIQVKA